MTRQCRNNLFNCAFIVIEQFFNNNCNLTQKTDARGVQIAYRYDNLDYVKTRSYSNEPSGQTATPNVTYTYDNLTNAKGKLIKVDNGFSKTEYTQFDLLGRVTKSKQTTDGTTYGNEIEYTYNLSGALLEETCPSGRVVKNTLDNEGDLQQVQSKKTNDTFRNYANSFNYPAAGAVSSMLLGDGNRENKQVSKSNEILCFRSEFKLQFASPPRLRLAGTR